MPVRRKMISDTLAVDEIRHMIEAFALIRPVGSVRRVECDLRPPLVFGFVLSLTDTNSQLCDV